MISIEAQAAAISVTAVPPMKSQPSPTTSNNMQQSSPSLLPSSFLHMMLSVINSGNHVAEKSQLVVPPQLLTNLQQLTASLPDGKQLETEITVLSELLSFISEITNEPDEENQLVSRFAELKPLLVEAEHVLATIAQCVHTVFPANKTFIFDETAIEDVITASRVIPLIREQGMRFFETASNMPRLDELVNALQKIIDKSGYFSDAVPPGKDVSASNNVPAFIANDARKSSPIMHHREFDGAKLSFSKHDQPGLSALLDSNNWSRPVWGQTAAMQSYTTNGTSDAEPVVMTLPSVTFSESAKTLTDHVQAKPPSPPSFTLQQFNDELARFVVKSFQAGRINGGSEARIKLVPDHLGHLDIKLSMQNGNLIAQFVTDTIQGKDMLDLQMSQLRTALQAHGIHVERLEVTHQSNHVSTSVFQDTKKHNDSQQHSNSKSKKQKSYEAVSEDFPLKADDIAAVRQSYALGSSFDVTA